MQSKVLSNAGKKTNECVRMQNVCAQRTCGERDRKKNQRQSRFVIIAIIWNISPFIHNPFRMVFTKHADDWKWTESSDENAEAHTAMLLY